MPLKHNIWYNKQVYVPSILILLNITGWKIRTDSVQKTAYPAGLHLHFLLLPDGAFVHK